MHERFGSVGQELTRQDGRRSALLCVFHPRDLRFQGRVGIPFCVEALPGFDFFVPVDKMRYGCIVYEILTSKYAFHTSSEIFGTSLSLSHPHPDCARIFLNISYSCLS